MNTMRFFTVILTTFVSISDSFGSTNQKCALARLEAPEKIAIPKPLSGREPAAEGMGTPKPFDYSSLSETQRKQLNGIAVICYTTEGKRYCFHGSLVKNKCHVLTAAHGFISEEYPKYLKEVWDKAESEENFKKGRTVIGDYLDKNRLKILLGTSAASEITVRFPSLGDMVYPAKLTYNGYGEDVVDVATNDINGGIVSNPERGAVSPRDSAILKLSKPVEGNVEAIPIVKKKDLRGKPLNESILIAMAGDGVKTFGVISEENLNSIKKSAARLTRNAAYTCSFSDVFSPASLSCQDTLVEGAAEGRMKANYRAKKGDSGSPIFFDEGNQFSIIGLVTNAETGHEGMVPTGASVLYSKDLENAIDSCN